MLKQNKPMIRNNDENVHKFPLPNSLPFFYQHIPISYLKSQCKLFENTYPDYVNWVRSIKSRKDLGCDVCKGLICPCQQIHGAIHSFMYNNGVTNLKKYETGSSCSTSCIDSSCLENLQDILTEQPDTFCIPDTEKNIVKRKEIYPKLNSFFKKCIQKNPLLKFNYKLYN